MNRFVRERDNLLFKNSNIHFVSQNLFEMLQLTGGVSERSDDGRSRYDNSIFPCDSCDPGGHWVGT